jgi:hypothetical protein
MVMRGSIVQIKLETNSNVGRPLTTQPCVGTSEINPNGKIKILMQIVERSVYTEKKKKKEDDDEAFDEIDKFT